MNDYNWTMVYVCLIYGGSVCGIFFIVVGILRCFCYKKCWVFVLDKNENMGPDGLFANVNEHDPLLVSSDSDNENSHKPVISINNDVVIYEPIDSDYSSDSDIIDIKIV